MRVSTRVARTITSAPRRTNATTTCVGGDAVLCTRTIPQMATCYSNEFSCGESPQTDDPQKHHYTIHALTGAIRCGDVLRVDAILRATPELINEYNRFGMTPLQYACDQDNTYMVELLLSNYDDLNINLLSSNGDTALMLATRFMSCSDSAFAQAEDVIEQLLHRLDLDLNIRDKHALTALDRLLLHQQYVSFDNVPRRQRMVTRMLQMRGDFDITSSLNSTRTEMFHAQLHEYRKRQLIHLIRHSINELESLAV